MKRFPVSFFFPLLVIFLGPVDHGLVKNGGATLKVPSSGAGQFSITTDAAVQLLKNFRRRAPEGGVWGEFFGRDALSAALNQPGCIGLRIYYGKRNDGTSALVLVGVDSSNADLLQGVMLESGVPCPPMCDTATILGQ